MSAEMIGLKLGTLLFGMAAFQAVFDKSVDALLEKAPYVGAVVGVVWIFSKLMERMIKDFRETIKSNQSTFIQTAKECHEVQMRSIETDERLLIAVQRMEDMVQAEKNAIERLEETIKNR